MNNDVKSLEILKWKSENKRQSKKGSKKSKIFSHNQSHCKIVTTHK